MIVAAAIVLISMSVNASEWDFYGSARVQTFITDSDLNNTTDFSESLQGNSRIGARVRVSDEVGGRFEYGASAGNANVRLLYGTWDFGVGQLTVGQDYTPLYMPVSNQVYGSDNGLAGWGEPYPGRDAQIKLVLGDFQIAAVATDSNYWNGTALVDTGSEVSMPAIEMQYKISVDNWFFGVAAGYNAFEINDQYDVDSYIGVVSAGATFGPVYLKGEVFAGENIGNMVSSDVSGTDAGKGHAMFNGTQVFDNEASGYELVAGYKINDMFSVETGVGYQRTELDGQDEDDVMAYYVQAPITLAPGVYIVPEIGRVDYKQSGQDEITYYGAKWQINF